MSNAEIEKGVVSIGPAHVAGGSTADSALMRADFVATTIAVGVFRVHASGSFCVGVSPKTAFSGGASHLNRSRTRYFRDFLFSCGGGAVYTQT